MSREQYTFDQVSREHGLDYVEEVPGWWLRRDTLVQCLTLFGCAVAFMALLVQSAAAAIMYVAFFAALIWRFGGWNNKFPSRITVNESSGIVVVKSGYRQRRKWPEHRFSVMQVASLERVGYAQEYPDAIGRMQGNGQEGSSPDLARARQFEVMKVVFSDGQQLDLAWQYGVNNAAALHKTMIDLFAHARQTCQTVQQQQARLAMLVPGDAPL